MFFQEWVLLHESHSHMSTILFGWPWNVRQKHCSKYSHHIRTVVTEIHPVIQLLLRVLTKLRDGKRVGKFILLCVHNF